jgi:hypothetical protein
MNSLVDCLHALHAVDSCLLYACPSQLNMFSIDELRLLVRCEHVLPLTRMETDLVDAALHHSAHGNKSNCVANAST